MYYKILMIAKYNFFMYFRLALDGATMFLTGQDRPRLRYWPERMGGVNYNYEYTINFDDHLGHNYEMVDNLTFKTRRASAVTVAVTGSAGGYKEFELTNPTQEVRN